MRTILTMLATAVAAIAVGSSWGQAPPTAPPAGYPGGPAAPAGSGGPPAPGGAAPAPYPFPAEMTIVVPDVEVRSGPTKEYYPTTKLTYGQRVVVLRESKDQPGWVAIKPPQGSFSWINAKNVQQVDQRTGYVVEGADVQVLPGSTLVNREPNVESARIKPGHLVVLLDRPMTVGQMVWYPIQPVPTEVRWIPVDAIRPVQTTSAWNQPSPFGQPGANSAQVQTLLAKADQALNEGNMELARQLYRDAAEKTQDYSQRNYAQTRLSTMPASPWSPNGGSGAYQPIPNNQTPPGVRPLTPGSNMSLGTTPPANQWTQPGAAATPPATAQWSGWGTLKRTALDKDGQPVFALENSKGQAMMYVVSGTGTSLRDYVNRMICLYGPVYNRNDDPSRLPYMVATHIAQQ